MLADFIRVIPLDTEQAAVSQLLRGERVTVGGAGEVS